MKQKIQEWFPNCWNELDEFYAEKANVHLDTWKEAMEAVVINTLLGSGKCCAIDPDLAKDIVRKVIDILPEGRKSSWTDEDGNEFLEFEVTPKELNRIYFKETRRILNALSIPD